MGMIPKSFNWEFLLQSFLATEPALQEIPLPLSWPIPPEQLSDEDIIALPFLVMMTVKDTDRILS